MVRAEIYLKECWRASPKGSLAWPPARPHTFCIDIGAGGAPQRRPLADGPTDYSLAANTAAIFL